jgi:predicted DNA-binding protein
VVHALWVSRLVSTSVYFEESQLTRLREESSAQRRPMAGLIREAIANWLSELERSKVAQDLAPHRRPVSGGEGEERGRQPGSCKHGFLLAFCNHCRAEEADAANLGSEGRVLHVEPG